GLFMDCGGVGGNLSSEKTSSSIGVLLIVFDSCPDALVQDDGDVLVERDEYRAKEGAPGFKVAILGAADSTGLYDLASLMTNLLST
ncbi:hypothetical protein S245_009008, partial [Arachis hypogaea]